MWPKLSQKLHTYPLVWSFPLGFIMLLFLCSSRRTQLRLNAIIIPIKLKLYIASELLSSNASHYKLPLKYNLLVALTLVTENAQAYARASNLSPPSSLQQIPKFVNTRYFVPWAFNCTFIISKSLSIQTLPYLRLLNDVSLRRFWSVH